MEPSAARLRRAVAVTAAVNIAVFGALALLFGVVLEPGKELGSCTAGLYPGPYADAIVPAHLATFAVLAVLAGWLSAQRSPTGRPGRVTLAALAAMSLFALAATVRHQLMDWPGLFGLIVVVPVGATAATAALIHTVILLRSGQTPELRWKRHAALAQAAAWMALVIGLPATLAGAWTNGAGLFCF